MEKLNNIAWFFMGLGVGWLILGVFGMILEYYRDNRN